MLCNGLGEVCFYSLLFLCNNWWKRYTYPDNGIPADFYSSLRNLIRRSNLRNLTLSETVSCFNQIKTQFFLVDLRMQHERVHTYQFVEAYNFSNEEFSLLCQNMRPFLSLGKLRKISDGLAVMDKEFVYLIFSKEYSGLENI